MWYQNIGSILFRFVAKHTCDRRTELRSQDRASIAASRGKKVATKNYLQIVQLFFIS